MMGALGQLKQMLPLRRTKPPSGHQLLREVTGITKPKSKGRFLDQRQMKLQMTCFIPFQTKETEKGKMIQWLLKNPNLIYTRDLLSEKLANLETQGE